MNIQSKKETTGWVIQWLSFSIRIFYSEPGIQLSDICLVSWPLTPGSLGTKLGWQNPGLQLPTSSFQFPVPRALSYSSLGTSARTSLPPQARYPASPRTFPPSPRHSQIFTLSSRRPAAARYPAAASGARQIQALFTPARLQQGQEAATPR